MKQAKEQSVKILPLGGLDAIGKNMTVFEYGEDIIIVDCGIMFPTEETPGIDFIIPDFSYVAKNRHRIKGILITHGHEDHIGALPFILKQINPPVYCTRLTAGLIEIKLEEAGLLNKVKINRLEAGQKFKAGCFGVELVRVNHSIADAVAAAITTPLGTVIHTGDFKIDATPVEGEMIDIARFGQLGKEGVLALMSDSTNAERPGYTMSERSVGENLDTLFKGCSSRIIVTTFASNVHRLQQIIDAAVKYGRKVAITGRSMENILRVATQLEYMKTPENTMIDISQVKGLPKNKVCVITTGSQGEPMSALYRMAFSGHKQIEIGAGDRVIISASPIPGNEKTVSKVINELFRKGAEVIYEKLAEVHVSGHACREELKLMLALTKPKYFMPIHGEYKHLRAHANLALRMGIPEKNIFIGETGRVFEITEKTAKLAGVVPSGRVLIDGTSVGDVGAVVLRDRKHLSEDGLIVVVVTLSGEDGALVSGPEIVSRGFIYMKESEELLESMRKVVIATVNGCMDKKVTDWATIKSAIRTDLSGYLYSQTKRGPMIIPVIMEV